MNNAGHHGESQHKGYIMDIYHLMLGWWHFMVDSYGNDTPWVTSIGSWAAGRKLAVGRVALPWSGRSAWAAKGTKDTTWGLGGLGRYKLERPAIACNLMILQLGFLRTRGIFGLFLIPPLRHVSPLICPLTDWNICWPQDDSKIFSVTPGDRKPLISRYFCDTWG